MQLSEVVEEHPSLIPVINRFGIRLGLGDKSVKEICGEHGLDVDFFLMVINTYLNEDYFPVRRFRTFHVSKIIDYLTKTNQYYARYQLPNIERHLHSFIAMSSPDNPSIALLGKFFRSFEEELLTRIQHDETNWFPYCAELVQQLEQGDSSVQSGNADEVEEDHIEALLTDLRGIMVRHLTGNYDENLCYAVTFSLSSLEKDFKQHNRIRYRILIPMVNAMEKKIKARYAAD
ncbi:MAG: helix-turn-helix transcriptional regulator [Parabacteroides sp.]